MTTDRAAELQDLIVTALSSELGKEDADVLELLHALQSTACEIALVVTQGEHGNARELIAELTDSLLEDKRQSAEPSVQGRMLQ